MNEILFIYFKLFIYIQNEDAKFLYSILNRISCRLLNAFKLHILLILLIFDEQQKQHFCNNKKKLEKLSNGVMDNKF